jgi:hypothetical protein
VPWIAGAAVAIVLAALWLPILAGVLAVVAMVAWLFLGRAPAQTDPPETGSPHDRHVEAQPFEPGPGIFQHDVPDPEPAVAPRRDGPPHVLHDEPPTR